MKIKSYFTTQNIIDSCVLFLTALLMYFHFVRLFVYAITIDDFEHLAAAWYVYHGAIPYIDFFEHHNPLWWVILSPIFRFVDNPYDSYIVARQMASVFFVGGLVMIGAIVYRLFGKIRPVIYTLFIYLAFPISNLCYMQNRPDTAMIFFMLTGIYTWILYVQQQRIIHLMVSYLSFFVSFLFLQKILLFLLPFGIYQLYLLWKKELPFRDFLIACILPVLGMGTFLYGLYAVGALRPYFELNYILNLHVDRDSQVYHTHPIEYLMRIGAVLGMVMGVVKGKGIIRHLSILALGFTLIFMAIPKPYEYYWFFWTPIAAIASGYWLAWLKWGWLRIEIILPLFFVMAFFFADARRGYDFSTIEMKFFQLSIPESAEIVSPNEALYAFLKPWPKSYYFWGRGLAQKVEELFHHSYPYIQYIDLIISEHPRYVGSNYPSEMNGRMEKLVKEIDTYYHRMPQFKLLEIWERNDPF